MTSRHRLFRALYRLGFTPWDGHPIAPSLKALVEGDQALVPGTALDIGCGTGDTAIYLAKHGWRVTGVDFVPKAVQKARAKADAAGVVVDFRHGDATKLTSERIGSGFDLILDSGCLHGMNDDDRASYVREVTAVSAPDTRLLLIEFPPGASFGVPGISHEEIERRFAAGWSLLSATEHGDLLRHYLFARAL
jgi:SAM-dependent methyltransferase